MASTFKGSFVVTYIVTVFGKANRLARKSIITYMYAQKWSFTYEDGNGNKEKEARLTQRLASKFDGGIFARRKR